MISTIVSPEDCARCHPKEVEEFAGSHHSKGGRIIGSLDNVLGEIGAGFAVAQVRLGPARVHHCMRAIGTAERALSLMTDRAIDRVAFGRPLARSAGTRFSSAPLYCRRCGSAFAPAAS